MNVDEGQLTMKFDNKLTKLKNYARKLKKDLFVLYLSYKDNRTPRYAKAVAICIVAYAFSPIDLIPDFIPFLGYLDDLILYSSRNLSCLKIDTTSCNRGKSGDGRNNEKERKTKELASWHSFYFNLDAICSLDREIDN